MESIWKYKLKITYEQLVQVPAGSKILCVQAQHEDPCIWVKVPKIDNPVMEDLTILTYGTGHKNESIDGEYIGTYQLQNGKLVFHVFKK